jgi:hypothetical protein
VATYMISDITVRDRAAFEIYRTRAADAIHTYGGRYLARLLSSQTWNGLARGIAPPSTHSPSKCATQRSAATSFSLMGCQCEW